MLVKFPSLEQFNRIHARETWLDRSERRAITYRAKIKLHGTNMGVCVAPDGTVSFQGRNKTLTAQADSYLFASRMSCMRNLWQNARRDEILTFFGEWAGPNICKGTAIQKTGENRFFIFAVGLGHMPDPRNSDYTVARQMVTNPESIELLLPDGLDRDMIRVLPFEGRPHVIDFRDDDAVRRAVADINTMVEALDVADPFVKRLFGISHCGEGYVLVQDACIAAPLDHETYMRTSFKAKTRAHRVQKQISPAQTTAPLTADAATLVDVFCTDQRIRQAIDDIAGGDADIKDTGHIIRWVTADIAKEAADEIAAIGGMDNALKRAIAQRTRTLFMSILDQAHMAG